MNSLFIASIDVCKKKAELVSAVMDQLHNVKAVLYKPVASADSENCKSTFTVEQVSEMLSDGMKNEVVSKVLSDYYDLKKQYEFVVCEGTDFTQLGQVAEFDLLATLASSLDVPVVLAVEPDDALLKRDNVTASCLSMLSEAGCRVAGLVGCGFDNMQEFSSEQISKYTSYVKPLKEVKAGDVTKEIIDIVTDMQPSKVTPLMFELELLNRAASDKKTIVMPEGLEPRIIAATDELLKKGICNIILIGEVEKVKNAISEAGFECPGVSIIDPVADSRREEYAKELAELRKKKGMTYEMAYDILEDETYYATMMVYKGDADGMVSGAVHSTADTVRPALQIIKTKPGASIVSSVFLMCLAEKVWVFGDCAVNPKPTSEQLAEIAVTSAETASQFGIDPKVAFLSYSSGSSGKGEDVEKVMKAVEIAKANAPELALDGPLQFDAASTPSVAATKMPDSKVAGNATVYVFPDLNAGNNCYKAVQRTADALAVGPVLQGLKKPVNDLSRGCTVPDIVNTIAITAVQAQNN